MDEIFWRSVLEDVAGRSRAQCLKHEFIGAEGREDENLRMKSLSHEGTGGLEPVHDRHADVHENEVWTQLSGELDGLGTVGRLGDDVDVIGGAEEQAQARTHKGLVVGDDGSDAHALISSVFWTGMRARSSKSG